jgi:hypothetical protein
MRAAKTPHKGAVERWESACPTNAKSIVMVGLGPTIHEFLCSPRKNSWMLDAKDRALFLERAGCDPPVDAVRFKRGAASMT